MTLFPKGIESVEHGTGNRRNEVPKANFNYTYISRENTPSKIY